MERNLKYIASNCKITECKICRNIINYFIKDLKILKQARKRLAEDRCRK